MTEKNRKYLTRKRDVYFLTLGLSLLLSLAGYIFYNYEADRIKNEEFNSLSAIAKLKTGQISDWMADEKDDAEILSKNSLLLIYIEQLLNKKDISVKSKLLNEFSSLIKQHNYKNIILTNFDGTPLLSTLPGIITLDSLLIKTIKNSLSGNGILSTDLYKDHSTNQIILCWVSPVKINNSKIKTALVFVIDPNQYLYPFIQTWPTPSKTAESILVRREGERVIFLNELRHRKNTSLEFNINLDKNEIPAVGAVIGKTGIFQGVDYRGAEVIANLNTVPGTNWFMVVKVDKDEIYSELYFRTSVIVVFILLLILLFGSGLSLVYHYRQKGIYIELYQKEKELWESHEEFKTILYSIGDGVITTDTKGNIKQMNPEAERLTGWKENEAKGVNLEKVFVIVNEETRNQVENPVTRVLKEGIIVGLANHTVLISKDGNEIPIADSGAPIKNKEKGISGVVLVFKDQTKENKIQKDLVESEERLRLALQSGGQGIYEYDFLLNELKFSPEYLMMFGYEPKVLVENAAEWAKRLHPEDRGILIDVYNDYMANKVSEYRVEFRQLDRNGVWRWILSQGKIVTVGLDGTPKKMLGTLIDITKLKKIENDLIEAKEKAENSEKIKSEFLAQMSHEIRSPINVILSYVELIRINIIDQLNQELLPGFESISSAGKRIIRTIDLILNMSDLHLGTYEVNKQNFQLELLLDSLIKEYYSSASAKGIELKLEVNSDTTNVITDEYAANQIFANLLDNAVKYTHNGNITIRLDKDNTSNMVVQVSDTGIGISDEYKSTIFTPFSQEEHGYSRKFDGNGLGLSLVKKYCDLLGAKISVESKKNSGTTFTIIFPSSK